MTVVCRRRFALLAGRSFQGILAAVSACVLRAGAVLRFSRVAMKFHGGVPAGGGDSAGIFEGFKAARARAVRSWRAHEGGAPGGSGVLPVVKRLLWELGALRPLRGRGGSFGRVSRAARRTSGAGSAGVHVQGAWSQEIRDFRGGFRPGVPSLTLRSSAGPRSPRVCVRARSRFAVRTWPRGNFVAKIFALFQNRGQG